MKKIFKYPVEDGFAVMPKENQLLRVDYVSDSQYEGWFAWAIIDTDNLIQTANRFVGRELEISAAPRSCAEGLTRHEIRVKEKQEICLLSPPVFAEEDDGKIYIYTEDEVVKRKKYTIHLYKTGQEIDIPIEKLTYIGLNRVWIVQELGLYTFCSED